MTFPGFALAPGSQRRARAAGRPARTNSGHAAVDPDPLDRRYLNTSSIVSADPSGSLGTHHWPVLARSSQRCPSSVSTACRVLPSGCWRLLVTVGNNSTSCIQLVTAPRIATRRAVWLSPVPDATALSRASNCQLRASLPRLSVATVPSFAQAWQDGFQIVNPLTRTGQKQGGHGCGLTASRNL